MIESVADLLLELKNREAEKLGAMDVHHGPTIGDMYEGLSRDLVGRVIPSEAGLRLVDGFVVDGLGGRSGQIDCMLVRGEGEKIPYTERYNWHVKDVLAVLEIKKNLYGRDLREAYEQLHSIRDLEKNYYDSLEGGVTFDVRSGERAFQLTTGLQAPHPDYARELDDQSRTIYHSLVKEGLSVIRIVFGYDGFKTESGFRKSLITFLLEKVNTQGYGIRSLPEVIVSGDYSLLKANGQPYISPIYDGSWPFYLSSAANPLRILLEFIWTRLGRLYPLDDLWGDDLSYEPLNPLFLGRVGRGAGGQLGWEVAYLDTPEETLAANRKYIDWNPVYLSDVQYAFLSWLLAGEDVNFADQEIAELLEERGLDRDEFKREMVSTRFVVLDGEQLRLVTEQLICAALPSGEIVAADDKTGQMSRWLAKKYAESQAGDLSS